MLRRIIAFVVAAAFMIIAGSAMHSLFVQRAWAQAAGMAEGGVPAAIALTDRIAWAAHDLVGMIMGYSAITSIALLVAFLVAGSLVRYVGARSLIFGIAGATAIFVLFNVMRMTLGTVGIFGARGAAGLGGQMLMGLLAGLIFARLAPLRTAAPPRSRALRSDGLQIQNQQRRANR